MATATLENTQKPYLTQSIDRRQLVGEHSGHGDGNDGARAGGGGGGSAGGGGGGIGDENDDVRSTPPTTRQRR
jgi:hypothetical protein